MHFILLFIVFLNIQVLAQETLPVDNTPDNEALHDELRTLKTKMITALNKHDIDSVLELVDEDMVFVPINGKQCKGKDAIRDYFDQILIGEERVVDTMEINLDVEELTTLHGDDTGVVYGNAANIFKLRSGMDLRIHASWTATLVNKNNRWLVASFQSTVNPFDNPIVNKSKSITQWLAIGTALAGCALGALIASIIKSKKSAV